MVKFNQKKFNTFCIENNIIGFFADPITLVSGRTSSWYVNWRTIASDVYLIDALADFVIGFCEQHKIKVNCFYGTPDGATKLAVICQYKWATRQPDYGPHKYVLAMGRKKPKDHGEPKDRYFVGAPTGKVVVIEDVTTTSASLIKTIDTLQKAGTKVVAALALTSRNATTPDGKHVADVLKAKGVKYLALSNAVELLPLITKNTKISSTIRQSIIDEFEQYGEQKISL